MNFKIEKYQPQYKTQWDNFVGKAKNATFLFYRDFMEYHNDRFEDFSLMVFKEEKLIAILPANKKEDTIYSHQGLTYGGLIFEKDLGIEFLENIFQEIKNYFKTEEVKNAIIKIIPKFYQESYSSAVEYLLFKNKARLIRRDLNYVIDLREPLNVHKSKLKFEKREIWNQLKMIKSESFTSFWNDLLIPVLKEQYNSSPVHTTEEITLLAQHFPQNILQYNVWLEGKIVAGMTLFCSGKVIKSQYGVVNVIGKEYRALDFLYISLLRKFKEERYCFFDMGTTNENDGYTYNKGLSKYKEEFGASPVNLDQYELSL